MESSDKVLILKACRPGTRNRCTAAVKVVRRWDLGCDVELLVMEWVMKPELGPHNGWLEEEMIKSSINGRIPGVLHLIRFISSNSIQERILQRCATVAASAGSVISLRGLTPQLSPQQLTASLVSSCDSGHVEAVDYLLSLGINPSKASSSGITPLWVSAREGNLEIVHKLIQRGALLNEKVNETTPLWSAAANGHDEVVAVLVNSGARLNECRVTDNASALWVASRGGHDKVVSTLLSHGASQVDTVLGQSPLWIASLCGHTAVVEILLSGGASAESAAITAAETAGHMDLVSTIKTSQKKYQTIDSCGGYIIGLLITYMATALLISSLLRWWPT